MNSCTVKRTILCRLPFGADLYDEASAIVRRERITLGRMHGLGATTHARLAYYDQTTRSYDPIEFPGGMEILSLHGNVSLRDAEPFVHLHIVLGDARGRTFGGHLLQGTKLFACELFIDELDGPPLERAKDDQTGLFLWTSGLSR